MQTDVIVPGIAQAAGQPFAWDTVLTADTAVMSDEHPTASRGLPVLVHNGRAYGPADLHPDVTRIEVTRSVTSREEVARIRAAGYTVLVRAYCDWCSEPLAVAEDWAVTTHSECAETRGAVRGNTDERTV